MLVFTWPGVQRYFGKRKGGKKCLVSKRTCRNNSGESVAKLSKLYSSIIESAVSFKSDLSTYGLELVR